MPLHGANRSKVFASAHALSELDLVREPLSAAAHTAGEHVRKLESSGAFSCSDVKPAYVENETSQVTYVGESSSTPSIVRQLSREGVKNEWRDEKTDGAADRSHTSCWPCHDPRFITPSWFSAPPGLALPMGSQPDYWQGHPGPTCALPLRGRDVLVQAVLPTTAQRYDVARPGAGWLETLRASSTILWR